MEKNSTLCTVNFEEVRAIVAQSVGMEPKDLLPSDSLFTIGIDSMDKAQLILDLEEAFSVEITDDEAAKFYNLQNIVDFVNGKRS